MSRLASAVLGLGLLALGACSPTAQSSAPTARNQGEAEHRLAVSDLGAFFDCLGEEGGVIVAAHRGGPRPGYAENALETFAHTLSQAPVALEIDVSRTRDGVLVLMHDEDVARTTNGSGEVASMSSTEFAALRLEDENGEVLDAHPPTLAQALSWSEGRTVLELDVKRGVPFEEVIDAVRAANAQNRVIIITYNDRDARLVHRLAPELMISVGIDDEAALARLARSRFDLSRALAWTGTTTPNPRLNRALQARGVETLFGTLGRPSESWDGRIARGQGAYADIAAEGVELIASDRAVEAYAALGAINAQTVAQCQTTSQERAQ